MNARAEALWARMRAAGAATGELPARAETPWYLVALTGIAAWIAAAFFIGFFAASFPDLWRTPALSVAIGGACCAFALIVLRILRGREFFEQFAIAFSLAGQFQCWRAFEHWSRYDKLDQAGVLLGPDWSRVWIGVALLAAVMYVLARHRMHRVLCGGIVAVAIAGECLSRAGFEAFATPVLAWVALALWWRSAAQDRFAPALAPLAGATTLVALAVVAIVGGGKDLSAAVGRDIADADAMLGQALVMPLLPVCAWWLSSRRDMPARHRWAGIVLAAVFGLLWWRAPAVEVGVCAMLIGFALYRPALLALGAIGLGVGLLRYYQQLDVPLIEKSYWLLAGGAASLLARAVWLRSRTGEAA